MGGRFDRATRSAHAAKAERVSRAGPRDRPGMDVHQRRADFLLGGAGQPIVRGDDGACTVALWRRIMRLSSASAAVPVLQFVAEKFGEGPAVSGRFEHPESV